MKTKNGKNHAAEAGHASRFISPKELAERWQCARPTVSRIVEREGLSRVYLGGGDGANGTVRYIREEIEAFEESRTVKGG